MRIPALIVPVLALLTAASHAEPVPKKVFLDKFGYPA